MTPKLKILLPIALVVVLIAVIGISSSKKEMKIAENQEHAADAPLRTPSGDVDDLFVSIDQSAEAEDQYTMSESDELPRGEGSDIDQSLDTNAI